MKYFQIVFYSLLLVACGGGGGSSVNNDNDNDNGDGDGTKSYAVSANAGVGGSITPVSQIASENSTVTLTVTPDSGFSIENINGCAGTLAGSTYTTGPITADCTVTVSFSTLVSDIDAQSIIYSVARPSSDSSDTSGITELFAVNRDGTGHVMLNDELVTNGDVEDFSWSPSGERVAYFADQDTDNVTELYSVLPSGKERTKLNANLVSGGKVVQYQWSPDGSKMAYIATQDSFEIAELFVVNADGSGLIKVNRPLVDGGNVDDFLWSPDGAHLVYKADLDTNETYELYFVGNDGQSHKKVNSPLQSGREITEYRWSTLGNYISYLTDSTQFRLPNYSLFAFGITLDDAVQLNPVGTEVIESYQWSNDESVILFRCETPSEVTLGCNGENLSLVKPNGQDLLELGPSLGFIRLGVFTKQNNIVAYDSGSGSGSGSGSVNTFDTSGSLLNRSEIEAGSFSRIKLSPDEKYAALYGSDASIYNFTTQEAVKIYERPRIGRRVSNIDWSSDSSRLSLGSSAATLISPNGSGEVTSQEYSNGRQGVRDNIWVNDQHFFISTGIVVGSGTLNRTDATGANTITLSQPFVGNPSTEIGSFKVSKNKQYIVYDVEGANNPFSGALNNEGEAIYAVGLDGDDHVRLNPDLEFFSEIKDYAIKP